MAYEQPDNDQVDFTLEDYSQPDNDAVDFSLVEGEDQFVSEDDRFDVDTNPLDIPLQLDLPMSPLTMSTMQVGVALFLGGLWAVLAGTVALFKNYAAGIVLFLAIASALFSGLFGIGLELHWILVAGTCFLLMAGMAVRWADA